MKVAAVVLLENWYDHPSPEVFEWLLSTSMMSWCAIVSFEYSWKVTTSPCWTVSVGPGSVMLLGPCPQPAGAVKLP